MTSEPKPGLRCRTEAGVAWLTISNPARLNAMALPMWRELEALAHHVSDDPDVRVVVIAGESEKAFCSGGDLSEFGDLRGDPERARGYDAQGRAGLRALRAIPKPTIAMIHGYCLGGGVAMAINCDIRLVSEDARLGITAAKLGLSYDFDEINLLVQLVGPAEAKMLLYTGQHYSGVEAHAIGLANRVHAAADLAAATRALAETIAANAPMSQRASKFIVDTVTTDPDKRDLAACVAFEELCLASRDYAEATRAFSEKRKPIFTGR